MNLFTNKLLKAYFLVILLFQMFSISPIAFADNKLAQLTDSFDYVDEIRGDSKVQDRDLSEFIIDGLAVLMRLVGVIALALIIFGGVMYITSAGDPKKAEQAKMIILYTVIGLLIIGAAALIVNFVIGIYK